MLSYDVVYGFLWHTKEIQACFGKVKDANRQSVLS